MASASATAAASKTPTRELTVDTIVLLLESLSSETAGGSRAGSRSSSKNRSVEGSKNKLAYASFLKRELGELASFLSWQLQEALAERGASNCQTI